ncbi:MAG: HD domain-containing protein [Anaerolineales bacterium]
MTSEEVIQRTADYVKGEFGRDASGHDWWHIARVWKTALVLCRQEGGDVFTVELAALLHDLDDWKLVPLPLHPSRGGRGAGGEGRPVRAEAWLRQMEVAPALAEHVCEIITGLSFKGALVQTPMRTLEGQIVQDADRLDAIGAIGIARAFAYGGHKGRLLYDPDSPPQMHVSFEQYQNSGSATINHFYEKLLLLKDRMNTPSAKKIAAQRHAYMEAFLEQFMREWEGGD